MKPQQGFIPIFQTTYINFPLTQFFLFFNKLSSEPKIKQATKYVREGWELLWIKAEVEASSRRESVGLECSSFF